MGFLLNLVYDVNMSDITGYQLRVLLRENVTMLRERISFNSGFKLGYAQSFSNAYTNDSEYDTTGNLLSDTSRFYNFSQTTFSLCMRLDLLIILKHLNRPQRLIIGNSFSYSIIWVKDVNDLERGSNYLTSFTSLVHPYLGAEIGKFGFRISMEWMVYGSSQRMYPYYYGYPSYSSYSPTLTTGLTFRFF